MKGISHRADGREDSPRADGPEQRFIKEDESRAGSRFREWAGESDQGAPADPASRAERPLLSGVETPSDRLFNEIMDEIREIDRRAMEGKKGSVSEEREGEAGEKNLDHGDRQLNDDQADRQPDDKSLAGDESGPSDGQNAADPPSREERGRMGVDAKSADDSAAGQPSGQVDGVRTAWAADSRASAGSQGET